MILKNLNQLALEAQHKFQDYNKEEVILTTNFKKRYAELYHSGQGEKISFAQYTTIIETSNRLTITFPNQWFYIASYFVDFLIALKEYKRLYNETFKNVNDYKEITRVIKDTGEIPIDVKDRIKSVIDNPADIELFNSFIADYNWWFGSKTIDRGDYFVSPVLNLAKVVNVTQSYIADLTYRLTEHPELLELLKDSTLSKLNPIEKNEALNNFSIQILINDVKASGLVFSESIITRFVASLLTKPFVLLTGLSGSGKTKIAQSFVKWICEDENQYKIIPVGADWTNREPLLGYPNGLNPKEYITPDSGALNLIIEASNSTYKPYFLILDEMNLSHVERYFADFLSVMESDDKINLYSGSSRKDLDGNTIPTETSWPKNLFIIGTVNIDETTYMFSPKVLDRANTMEFRVDETNIKSFFDLPSKIDLTVLESKGASMAKNFLEIANDNSVEKEDEYTTILVKFFNELKKVGAEFGYRTAVEMLLLIKKLNSITSISKNESIDIAVMQKLLPKLHGSRSKISKVLDALILLCLKDGQTFSIAKSDEVLLENILYPIAFEKLVRMYKNALDNGFTSYAEA